MRGERGFWVRSQERRWCGGSRPFLRRCSRVPGHFVLLSMLRHFVLFSMLRHFVLFSTLRHYVLFSMLRHFVPFSTLRVKMRVEAMV